MQVPQAEEAAIDCASRMKRNLFKKEKGESSQTFSATAAAAAAAFQSLFDFLTHRLNVSFANNKNKNIILDGTGGCIGVINLWRAAIRERVGKQLAKERKNWNSFIPHNPLLLLLLLFGNCCRNHVSQATDERGDSKRATTLRQLRRRRRESADTLWRTIRRRD